MAAHCKVCNESKQCKLEQTADHPVNLMFSDDGFYNPDACFPALFDITSAAGRSQVSDIIYVGDADQSHPEVVSGLCHVDGINVIDGELLVGNAAVAVSGSGSRQAAVGMQQKNHAGSCCFAPSFPDSCASVRISCAGRSGGFSAVSGLPPESGTYFCRFE